MSFSEVILQWYSQNKRPLPWRNTTDPYKIWLSEIILQQTRVAQGTPYYETFVQNFPTVYDLANASEEHVLKLWQGLGYYSRARNLHTTAKAVVADYKGVFPTTYAGLMELKGVGDYTASAVSSICFNEMQPVVDGNVYRVLARYFGISLAINSSEGISYFKKLAKEVMPTGQIRDYNQGIMEFGAIHCTPKNPNCGGCPLHTSCKAFQEHTVKLLPVKQKKLKIRKRYFNYVVPLVHDRTGQLHTVFKKREGKGIWENLYEFPLIESDMEIGLPQISSRIKEVLPVKGMLEIYLYNSKVIVHKLSHQHLYTQFWIMKTGDMLPNSIPVSAIYSYAVPVLIADFINKNSFKI